MMATLTSRSSRERNVTMRSLTSLVAIGALLIPFAAPAATAGASLRIATKAQTSIEEIEANLSVLKTDRRLLDEISARLLLPESWKLDADQTARKLAEKLSVVVQRQGATATLEATDDSPTQAAILANTAASVLRDHFEGVKMDPEEFKAAVAEQEAAVTEKRKLLSQIIRTEGVIQKEASEKPAEPTPEETVKAGIAAQSFMDAKKDFEAAQQKLEVLKNGNIPRKGFSIDHIRWAKSEVE